MILGTLVWIYPGRLWGIANIFVGGNFHFGSIGFKLLQSFFLGFSSWLWKFVADGSGESIALVLDSPDDVRVGSGLYELGGKLL